MTMFVRRRTRPPEHYSSNDAADLTAGMTEGERDADARRPSLQWWMAWCVVLAMGCEATPATQIDTTLLPPPADACSTPVQAVVTLTISTTSDAVNGNAACPSVLVANPGPDGISLREALAAAHNAQGPHFIAISPSLRGQAISLTAPLPPITRDGITIDGLVGSDGQADVTIDGRGAGDTRATFFVAASLFTLRNIRFTYVPSGSPMIVIGGFIVRGESTLLRIPPQISGVRIIGCSFSDAAKNNVAITVGTHLAVRNASISDVVISDNTFSAPLIALTIGGPGSGNIIRDVVIQRNTFADHSTDNSSALEIGNFNSIDNAIRQVQILENRFIGNRLAIHINNAQGSGPTAPAVFGNVVDSTLIARNTFMELEGAIGAAAGLGDRGAEHFGNVISNTAIVNNLIVRQGNPEGRASSLHFFSNEPGQTGNRIDGMRIVNNTFTGIPIRAPTITFEGVDGYSDVLVLNTMIWPTHPSAEGDIRGVDPSNVRSSIVSQSGYTGTNGNYFADPQFVDTAREDYRLAPSSPARGRGMSLGAPADDLNCQLRSHPPSIGAFEGNGPRICLPSPSTKARPGKP